MEADIVCFGHTHRAFLEELDDIIFLNPGSLTFPKGFSNETYAIAKTSEKSIQIDVYDMKQDKPILSFKKQKKR